MTKQTIIFSDFDGTFCERDVGHRIFTHFSSGANLKFVEMWKKGNLSTRNSLLNEAALLNADEKEILKFTDQFGLRTGAREFYYHAKSMDIPFYIVSDGGDLYIKRILKNQGLEEIEFFTNRVTIKDKRYLLEFPYDNGDCTRCGCCKGARIQNIISKNRNSYRIVFIGDGLSDICALPHADIIFARGDLLDYCLSNNINACEYRDFFDILEWLKNDFSIY